MDIKPLLICMTPVRNEAWILNAFLKATSLWADYIIIADQGSTDGSREIAFSYSKVILVDNLSTEMHQAQARKMLFEESRKIKGKKILFALDADEFLSGDFVQSNGWQKILNSKVGDVFYFNWINLCNSSTYYIPSDTWMYWATVCEDEKLDGEFPDKYIHEWRLPYPKYCASQTFIDDISFIHFAQINILRQKNKTRFYQVVTKLKEPNKSITSIYRMYNFKSNETKINIEESIYSFYLKNGLDLLKEIDLMNNNEFYTQQTILYFQDKGLKYFQGLDIWQKTFLNEYNIKDPRSLWMKMIHFYLENSQNHVRSIIIRGIDKTLKIFGF